MNILGDFSNLEDYVLVSTRRGIIYINVSGVLRNIPDFYDNLQKTVETTVEYYAKIDVILVELILEIKNTFPLVCKMVNALTSDPFLSLELKIRLNLEKSNIRITELRYLIELLEKNKRVKQICISNNPITEQTYEMHNLFYELPERNCKIFDIYKTIIDKKLYPICKTITNNDVIYDREISNFKIRINGFYMTAESILNENQRRDMPTILNELRCLLVNGNVPWSDKRVLDFSTGIKNMEWLPDILQHIVYQYPEIRALNLSGNNLNVSDLKHLVDIDKSCPKLEYIIVLNNDNIKRKRIKKLRGQVPDFVLNKLIWKDCEWTRTKGYCKRIKPYIETHMDYHREYSGMDYY